MTSHHFARQLHLWLGCLFAPLLVFFAISGALQTLGFASWLTKDVRDLQELSASKRAAVQMAQAHMARRYPMVEVDGQLQNRPLAWTKDDPKTVPYSAFVTLMSVGLVVTTLLGVWMAFRFGRHPRVTFLLLAVGILIPFLLYKLRFAS